MSMFNPEAFMAAQITESFDTQSIPVPEGDYPAYVKDVKVRQTTSGKTVADVVWSISGEAMTESGQTIKTLTGFDEATVRQSVFLDLTDSGGLAGGPGKNVQLGRLREALGQNERGKPWSFDNLRGGTAMVKVKHRIDGDTVYTDVKGVAPLAA